MVDGSRSWCVRAGTVIVEAGAPAIEIHVVRSGVVELCRPADPRRPVISSLGPGAVFGDVSHLLRRRHHLDAVAATEAELVSVHVDHLDAVLARSPRLALAFSESLAERVLETHERLGELLAGHLVHRVAAVLLRRVDEQGRVELTQEAMARLLGVQRSSVNDVIRRLEILGVAHPGYGHVVVTDPDGLAAMLSS